MKLLPRNAVDEQEDNGQTYCVEYEEGEGELTVAMKTRTEIRKLLAQGKVRAGYGVDAQKILEQERAKSGHTSAPVKKHTDGYRPPVAAKKVKSRVAARKGRGFTRAEQLRGAAAGGKARAARLTKKQRRESARKAVLARWAKRKAR